MSELTRKVQNDFDRIALLEPVSWDHNRHYHNFLLKQLPPSCERMLEIGCGTGTFSRLLAKRAEKVVAVDLSPTMIEVAKQQSGRHTNIDFQVADILSWKFPVEQFDAILSIATVHHLPLETLLPKLKMALKPGGKLVILDLLDHEGIQDILIDLIAVPLSWLFRVCINKRVRLSSKAAEAWREHGRTDKYLTHSQAQQIYTRFLTGPMVKRQLFWRYSVVWEKLPAAV